jgi:Icc-related predicted phosphoesterase|tara:strand:+ start:1426 stop:2292 length:867 start_codon:yes stop_codon:yes gene_type:complete
MKFLVIGDLHGNKPKIIGNDFDCIIAPGDFCSDKPRKYMFESMRRSMKNKKDSIEWYEICGKKKAKEMIKKSLKDGRKILEYLNSFDVPVFALPGNWDWTGDKGKWKFKKNNFWKTYLIKDLKNIKDCHKKVRKWKGVSFVGHGETSSPEKPTKETLEHLDKKEIRKKERKYSKIMKFMNKKFKESKSPLIFLTHNVPYNTKLDKIDNSSSPMHGKHMGSYVARELINNYQPLICIGGHMHETFGKTRIKKTLCINAGFGSDVLTTFEIKGGKVKNLKFLENGKVVKK